MSGIYIHIPFCKQACHYCDFHFSTSQKYASRMVRSIIKEIELRRDEIANDSIQTIYFGGGTPSILETSEIQEIIDSIYSIFKVEEAVEITLEANPDDLSSKKVKELSTVVNRLSIGIQSFHDQDLIFMNRAHSAKEAIDSLQLAIQYFDNITIDLIYGIPGLTNDQWRENIDKAIELNIPHISSYALTVEENTALHHFIKKGQVPNLDDSILLNQFTMLVSSLEKAGYIQYEISNFGKPFFFSKHNTSYWFQRKYLGVGPSAHSFDGNQRSWNISNNIKYINSIENNVLPITTEKLTLNDKYNEYIMTGLRTIWGVSVQIIISNFGNEYAQYFLQEIQKFISQKLVTLTKSENEEVYTLTNEGKFLADGIASSLFII